MSKFKYFQDWITLKSNLSKIILILLLIFFLLPAYRPYLQWAISELYLNNQIEKVAKSITKDSKSINESIEKIFQWQQKNMKNIFGENCKRYYFDNCLYPFCIRLEKHKNPSWILLSKCGACDEYALIFTELANSVNITTRSVHHHGGNHNWAEVLINNQWVIVNPASPPLYRNSSSFGSISYVYSIDKDGKKEETTNRYVDTNKLIVFVLDNGDLSEKAKVVIESKKDNNSWSIDNDCFISYKEWCELNLGEGEYKVTAISGNLIKYKGTKDVNLNESVKSIYLKPKNIDWIETLSPRIMGLTYLLSIITILWFCMGLVISSCSKLY